MYKFRDTNKRNFLGSDVFIPTSAMSYDNMFLEELIEGYQTLSVEGREMYSLDFESQEMQVGGVITNVKYPPRELTIKYKLEDRDSQVLQEKFDTLKAFLIRQEDVPIIFNDDLEYTFYGRFQTADNVAGDTNSIISSFNVLCSDPFKHGKTRIVKNKVIEVLPYPIKPDKLSFKLLTDGLLTTDGKYCLKSSQAKKDDLLEFDFQTGDTILNGKVNNNILDLDSDFRNIRLTTGTDFSSPGYNRAYIGVYVDYNVNDSTNPSDYSWTLVEVADSKTPYFYTAWSYSADGTDGFTTVYPNPNLNLIDGTKDFSGTWTNSSGWVTDGTYKGVTVKKRTSQWNGIYKTFTAPKDGVYTFSAYVKSSGSIANIARYVSVNDGNPGIIVPNKTIGNNFDWLRDSFKVTLKAGDTIYAKYEITGSVTDSILLVAGHKWELGSTATPWMPSKSEVKPSDYPSYIGQYADFTQADSTKPSDYTWSLIRGNDGKTQYTHIAYANSADGVTDFSTSNYDLTIQYRKAVL